MCCVQSVYFCTAFIRSSLRSVGLWCYSFRRTLHNGNERAMCDAAASHSARKLRRIYIYIQTPFTHSARTSRPHTHVHARCVWNHRSECARLTCTQILVYALCSTRTRTRKTRRAQPNAIHIALGKYIVVGSWMPMWNGVCITSALVLRENYLCDWKYWWKIQW